MIVECDTVLLRELRAEGFAKDKRTELAFHMRNGCTGFNLRIVFCELRDSSQDGESQSSGRQGQGDCHWLIIRLPLRWRQLASVLTHSITHSPCLKVPGNALQNRTSSSECKVMPPSVLHLTFFCSSTSVFSIKVPCSFYYHTDTVLCTFTLKLV